MIFRFEQMIPLPLLEQDTSGSEVWEAEALVLAGYDKLAAKLGPGHWRTAGALDRVIELYDAWGRREDAAAYRAKKPSSE